MGLIEGGTWNKTTQTFAIVKFPGTKLTSPFLSVNQASFFLFRPIVLDGGK